MKKLSGRFTFFANLSLCFVLSDITVLICHIRNPFLGFLNSTASYVLFALSALCLLVTLILGLKCRRRRKIKAEQRRVS